MTTETVHLYASSCDPDYYFWCGEDDGYATACAVENVTCVRCLRAFTAYADKVYKRLAQLTSEEKT